MSLILALALPLLFAASSCDGQAVWTGCPETTISNGSVDVHATHSTEDERGEFESGGSNLRGENGTTDSTPEPCPLANRCGGFTVVTRHTATIDDVASFAPEPSPLITEPAGIGIAGLPVNLTVAATTHVAKGELFDERVVVRFTPIRYQYDYDDGTTHASTAPGRTWAAQHLPQFAATDTTHVYTERGTYRPAVSTTYGAEIDYGTGWRTIPGHLTLTDHTTLRILEAHTALVEHTCAESPRAPGC